MTASDMNEDGRAKTLRSAAYGLVGTAALIGVLLIFGGDRGPTWAVRVGIISAAHVVGLFAIRWWVRARRNRRGAQISGQEA